VFEGFLPHKKGKQTRITGILNETRTVVFYESPHRLLKTLEMCRLILGPSRQAAVVRELSKMFEECVKGSFEELITHFTTKPPKGEIVLIIGGAELVNETE
jgi:16S rRNA (cytidine1402-2'-O)-methyltransferase